MTITLHWWLIVLTLFIAPFVYSALRPHQGDWDFAVDGLIVLVGCWCAALALLLGYWIGR